MLRFLKEAVFKTLWEYSKTILGFVILIGGLGFFIPVIKVTDITGFFVLFLLPIGIPVGYFTYRMILENVSENMFGDTFAALITIIAGIFSAVYIQGKVWSDSEGQVETNIILFLILSCILWITGIHLIFQTYPIGSGKAIQLLKRELQYSERQKLDWLQEGKKDYTVEVFKLDRVPYDINSINKDAKTPLKIETALKQFFRGRRTSEKQRVMIVIGSFGTGKSTALVNGVIHQLNTKCHGHSVPVYVKLRDCLEFVEGNPVPKKDFFNKICGQYNSSEDSSFNDTIFRFHQNRKVIYIFDGLNEVLQMTKTDEVKEAEAQRIANYLYSFTAGNDCIISFYPMPGILTSQSLSIDNPNRDYRLYGVYGIAEAENEKKKLRKIKNCNITIPDSVALFRMYEMLDSEDRATGNTYDLIEGTLETRLDALISGSTNKMVVLEKIVNDYLASDNLNMDLSTPYSPIITANKRIHSDLCDIRILQESTIKEEVSDNDDAYTVSTGDTARSYRPRYEYRFCHILIFEFFVARVILSRIEKAYQTDSANVTVHRDNTERENIKSILWGTNPEYLGHIHIEEINKMVIEKIKDNADKQKYLLSCLLLSPSLEPLENEDKLKYLAFLVNTGIDEGILKNFISDNSCSIDINEIDRLNNEKLKIDLLGIRDSRSAILEDMVGWNSSFVALKREYFNKTDKQN